MGEREGLIARIRQVRRVSTAAEQPKSTETDAPQDGLRALQARVEHLEQQLEGLQDSVHRETERQTRLIAELQDQVRPESMGAALAEDARRRGL